MSSREKEIWAPSDTDTRTHLDDDQISALKQIAKSKKVSLRALIRSSVLQYIDDHPLKKLADTPSEESLRELESVRPDAVVYTLPVTGFKIVSSPHPEGGWRGVIFDPSRSGTMAAWNSDNLAAPVWARTPWTGMVLTFVASRIDDNGASFFRCGNFLISAEINTKNKFYQGRILSQKKSQEWTSPDGENIGLVGERRKNECHFNSNRTVVKLLTILARARRVSDKGIQITWT